MKIRILPWGGIGDALLVTPALRALRGKFPEAKIQVFCGHRAHIDVFTGNPNINVLKLVPGLSYRSWLTRYPLLFPRVLVDRLLLYPGYRGSWRRSFRVPAYGLFQPAITCNRHACELVGELLGVEVTNKTLEVFLDQAEEKAGKEICSRYRNPVVIHVTSQCCESQNWPLLNWNRLVERNSQYTFLQVGLKSEARVDAAVDLRGTLSLRECFAVIKHAKGFVGVVSSMAHASNAVGTPGVVLFGPSAPSVWSHSNIREVSQYIRCAPCIDYVVGTTCPYGAPCIAGISVTAVENALHAQFGNQTCGVL